MDEQAITILALLMKHDYLSGPKIQEALGMLAPNIKSIHARLHRLDEFVHTLNPNCRIIHTKNKGYHLTQDYFNESQKIFLRDLLQSNHVIKEDEKEELISLFDVFIPKKLNSKQMSQSYFDKITTITKAIKENHKIRFKYYSYKVMVDRVCRMPHQHGNVRESNQLYEVSPYLLKYNDGRYYLLAGFSDRQRKIQETRLYRLDRMEQVISIKRRRSYYQNETEESILLKANTMIHNFLAKDDALYSLAIKIDASIVNAFIEEFGDRVHFEVPLDYQTNHQVLASLEDVPLTDGLMNSLMRMSDKLTVLSPPEVVEKMKERALDLYQKYGNL